MHTIKFERSTHNGMYRATCTCGWGKYDYILAEVQSAAAVHELNPIEWEAVEALTAEPK